MVYLKLLFQELKVQNVFFPIASVKGNTKQESERETEMGGREATSTEDAGAIGCLLKSSQ